MATIACVQDLGQLEANAQSTGDGTTAVALATGANTITGCTDRTVVVFRNTNAGASRTVTIVKNKTAFRSGSHGSVQVADITVTVPQSTTVGGVVAICPPSVDYVTGSTMSITGDANAADVIMAAWALEQR